MNSSHLLLPFASSHLWQSSCSMVKHSNLCVLGERVDFPHLQSEEPQSWRKRESMQMEQKGEDGEEAGPPAQDNNLAQGVL